METQAQRLTRLRKAKGLTQAQLAALAGFRGQGAIGNIERGTRGYGASIVDVARVLGTNPNYLRMESDDPSPTAAPIDLTDNPDYPAIRRVRFKLSAGADGFGVEYLDEQGAPIVFQRQWFERNSYEPAKLFAVGVANGSMEPGLYDGDVVVVNTAATDLKDGVVYAVNYEGQLTIKRLVRDAGQWWLSSDNPDKTRYPRKVCHEDTFIIGEIVHKQSERI